MLFCIKKGCRCMFQVKYLHKGIYRRKWYNTIHVHFNASYIPGIWVTKPRFVNEYSYLHSSEYSFLIWKYEAIYENFVKNIPWTNGLRPSDRYVRQQVNHHLFLKWSVRCLVPTHYLSQCWYIVNLTLRNKFQWNLNKKEQFLSTKLNLNMSSTKG